MNIQQPLLADAPVVRRRRRWRFFAAAAAVLATGSLALMALERQETSRLGRDTRIVVRFPEAVIDRLTADTIVEHFPIQETTGNLEVTGTAKAVGQVSVNIQPHAERHGPDDIIIFVNVVGTTDNYLVGEKAPVKIIGDGRGRFHATKPVHFDGFTFTADEETTVDATHETEIVEVEPLPGTPLQGIVRLIAGRDARAALPALNLVAADRIKEKVRERMDQLIAQTVEKLNQLNFFPDTIARLHPHSETWRIAVGAQEDFVQAALVPHGGRPPELPVDEPATLEVWMRLTRSQRTAVRLINLWKQSDMLFRRFVSPEQAQRFADEMTVHRVGDWTYLRIGEAALKG